MPKPVFVIIAGGLATRMKPVTEEIPKCLIDVSGKPLIQHQVEYLAKRGYNDFIFCVAHLADKVKEHFDDGSAFGINVKYSHEPKELLGTAGAVKFVENMVGDICIVYYGDNLTTIDFDKALEFHRLKNSDFTVLLRPLPEGYKSSSIITLDESGKVTTFFEKPPQEEFDKHEEEKMYINDGIYIMNRNVFSLIPKNTKFDFAKDLIPLLMERSMNFYGYVSSEFFRELGRVEKYEKFKEELKERGKVLE
ncbi:MAG: nucleotidyltransferase family protein [Nanoarchaeota archaeon]